MKEIDGLGPEYQGQFERTIYPRNNTLITDFGVFQLTIDIRQMQPRQMQQHLAKCNRKLSPAVGVSAK